MITSFLLVAANSSRRLSDIEMFWIKTMNKLADHKGLIGRDKVEWVREYLYEVDSDQKQIKK
jgi:hypothetical protein